MTMIRNLFNITGLLITMASLLFPEENYFQQFVHYTMKVKLDVREHNLTGHSNIRYTNNSPDELTDIYLHLLPNAFQEGSVKHREYLQYNGYLGRAEPFVKGNESYCSKIDVSHFLITKENESVSDSFNVDDTILTSHLSQPLKPGETLTIQLDWIHHIGEQVERAGRVGDQYNMAQWYPKMVVYDEKGWHPIPFHASGEFYGEFGTYDVTLDVPSNYIIGATGVVTDGDPGWSEVTVDTSKDFTEWLETFQKNKTKPDSTLRRKATFHAEEVHDFAWITSPTFLYEYGSWNGIDVHVLFNESNGEKWTKKVVVRSQRALEWLSTHFGMYPYPQVTTTDRNKGGGMEYPMLVMNGSESEGLIVHEIGHIWFYGILGNNETDEAWLDEGFTTFQTREYMINRYGPLGFDLETSESYKPVEKKYGRFTGTLDRYQWSAIHYQASGDDEPISRKSFMFNHRSSYRYNAYTKPSLMLTELKYVLGDSVFTNAMKIYFDRWQLKHVNEKRFINVMEEVSGKELDWFFDSWLHNTRPLDYRITQWKKSRESDGIWKVSVTIEKLGIREMPQLLEVTLKDGSSERFWWENHLWRKKDIFTFKVKKEPESVVLDPDVQTLDIDYRNNGSGRLKVEKQFQWIDSNYNPRDRYVLKWFPTLGYHDLDGFIPGMEWTRKYDRFETKHLQISYALDSQKFYWAYESYMRPVQSYRGFSTSFHAYDFGGVDGYGLKISNRLDEKIHFFTSNAASIGFYVTYAKDTTRTNLFDPGQVALIFGEYLFSFNPKINVKLDFATTVVPISNWAFTRLNGLITFDYQKDKIGIRNRSIIGHILSDGNVPSQERYTIEGAGSGDLYAKPFLRDESTFYGNIKLRNRYHLPGDGNLRGYFGEGLVGVESIIANSFEIFYHPAFKPVTLELAAFLDDGWVWGSKLVAGDEGFNGDYLIDAGVGVRINKTIFGKNFYLRIDTPFIRKDMSKSP